MRRWITMGMMFILSLTALSQQVYRWVAPAGEWAVPGNWFPARTAPGTGDTLVFGDTARIYGLPASEEIALVGMEAGAHITFDAPLPAIIGMKELDIETGAFLEAKGSGGLELHLIENGSGHIYGSISFTEGPHRLLATGSGKVYFEGGSLFRAGSGFTGSPFGAAALNSILFREGATYTSIAGANPFGAAAPSSVVVFEDGSIYRHQRATAPQLSGRQYGHFEIAAAASYNLSLPRDVVIRNNLIVRNGQFLFRPSGGAGNLLLGGNLIHEGNGQVLLGHEPWPGEMQLTGTEEHIFEANTQPLLIHRMAIKGADLRLKRPVSITGRLLLEKGVIFSSDTATLRLEPGAELHNTGQSAYHRLPAPFMGDHGSYIDGPLVIRGIAPSDTVVFPVGGLGYARPVLVSGQAGDVRAEYREEAPAGALLSGLSGISATEYWKIGGLQAGASLQLSFLQPMSGGIADTAHIRIAMFSGGQWMALPNPYATGAAGSHGAIHGTAGNGDLFTLGSTHPATTLPVREGRIGWKKRGEELELRYYPTVNEEIVGYQWSCSFKGRDWVPWGSRENDLVTCTARGLPGAFPDPRFRLVRRFKNGDSSVLEITVPHDPGQAYRVYPNPAREKIFIFFKDSSSRTIIDIVSITGTIVQKVEIVGRTREIDVRHLPPGMYFLHLRNKNNPILPFLKQ